MFEVFGPTPLIDMRSSLLSGTLELNLSIRSFETLFSDDAFFLSWKMHTPGLLKSHLQPWMAVSPDGILSLEGTHGVCYILIEYKCPASKRHCLSHPYKKYQHNVPEYYMDQLQGIMGLCNKFPYLVTRENTINIINNNTINNTIVSQALEFTNLIIKDSLFVVWQPNQAHVTRIPFNLEYYKKLENILHEWYFKEYILMAYKKHKGLLVNLTLDTILTL
jgi:hypothetical protein